MATVRIVRFTKSIFQFWRVLSKMKHLLEAICSVFVAEAFSTCFEASTASGHFPESQRTSWVRRLKLFARQHYSQLEAATENLHYNQRRSDHATAVNYSVASSTNHCSRRFNYESPQKFWVGTQIKNKVGVSQNKSWNPETVGGEGRKRVDRLKSINQT